MAPSAQLQLLRELSPFWEADDKIVDALLRTANGPDRSTFGVPREEVLRLQAEFEPLVQMAIDKPDALYEQEYNSRFNELRQGGVEVTLGSAITRTGRSRPQYIRNFRDIHAVLSQGVLLLLDPQRSYGKALCRCGLPSCQKFYLARRNPKGGPANRTYCSPKHRDEHHNSGERKTAAARRHK